MARGAWDVGGQGVGPGWNVGSGQWDVGCVTDGLVSCKGFVGYDI